MLKKRIVSMLLVLAAVFSLGACSKSSDEPCDWCGKSPSQEYKLSSGEYAHVCKDCSEDCMFCGKKATKHYENLAGTLVFACDDCYSDM